MTRNDWADLLTLRTLSARDRRAVLTGLAVLVPALLFIGVVRPYRTSFAELRDRTATERALLEREEALIAQAATLPNTVQATATRAQRAADRLVRAANVPLAEAELTSILERMATLSRVLLQEMRGIDLPRGHAVDSTSALRPIRLSVRGESDLEGVLTFLQRAETSPLLLRIVELSIEPIYDGDRAARVPTGVVQFAFIVEAYAPADIDRGAALEELSP